MTPYEKVTERYALPFPAYRFQIDEINTLSELPRCGFYWEPGAGKTSGATIWALHQLLTHGLQQAMVVMPPILLYQWQAYLQRIIDRTTGKPLRAEVLAGTPKQRGKVDLNAQFLLMSYGILKNDFDRLESHFSRRRFLGLCDEATAIKNIESGTHKAVHLMFEQTPLALLTGTPINKPGDAYGYMRLVSPHLYRNHRHFLRTHVEKEDDYGNVETWANLELLAQNMRVHTSRIIRRQVRDDLPEVIYTPITYRLDPAHYKLYERIASERLVEMEGKVIDAISAGKLRSALQQVVINWGEFDENPNRRPAVLDLIDEVMEEVGEGKLVVAAHFLRTNRLLEKQLQQYGAVAVYGEITPKGKQAAINRFISDPSCRCILVQPSSAGVGVDGLQHVCSDMLIVEAPTTPTPFEQVVKRLDRDGQKDVVNIRIAIAQSTVQVRMFRDLLNNDALANQVQGGYQDLKDAVYGT